jgi:hypothetical protein
MGVRVSLGLYPFSLLHTVTPGNTLSGCYLLCLQSICVVISACR